MLKLASLPTSQMNLPDFDSLEVFLPGTKAERNIFQDYIAGLNQYHVKTKSNLDQSYATEKLVSAPSRITLLGIVQLYIEKGGIKTACRESNLVRQRTSVLAILNSDAHLQDSPFHNIDCSEHIKELFVSLKHTSRTTSRSLSNVFCN